MKSEMNVCLLYNCQKGATVGARIPNKFGIRMVHCRSVLIPTIRKQNILNIQNGRSKLGRFIYKEEIFYLSNSLG